jgi:hypothetical protein
MLRRLALGLVIACLTPAARADDPVFSGPQPGEKLTPFRVLGFAGPDAGKEVELPGRTQGAPTVLVFVHEVTRPAFQLLRPLDLYAAKLAKDGLACHFVWLSADKTKTEEFLNRAKGSLALRSPVVISLDGPEGPGNYGLNRKVTLTILVAKDNKVVANFALVQPNETDAPRILQAVAGLMGQKAPTLDELRKELGQGRPAMARPAAQPKTDKELPGRTSSDPELIGLMRRMIQPTNDEAKVREIAELMTKWAGDNSDRKKELAEFCKRVAHLKYGTEAAQKALKQMAGE